MIHGQARQEKAKALLDWRSPLIRIDTRPSDRKDKFGNGCLQESPWLSLDAPKMPPVRISESLSAPYASTGAPLALNCPKLRRLSTVSKIFPISKSGALKDLDAPSGPAGYSPVYNKQGYSLL